MATAIGITASAESIDILAKIFESGVEAFKDGVQLSDVKYLPNAISLVYQFVKKMPAAVLELKDLDTAEIGTLIGILATRIVTSVNTLQAQK